MAERSGVFNSSAGDRKYTSANLAEGFYTFQHGESGVVKGVENSLSLASGAGYATTLATGRAVWLGRWYVNDAAKTMTSDAVTILNKRIDRIVIRMDSVTARSMAATIIKGTETTGTPSAPALGANDVALYQVLFDNTTGAVTQALTDERDYCTVGNANSDLRGTHTGNVVGNVTGLLNAKNFNTTHSLVTMTGSGNWTCPAGVYLVRVAMGGGGGGGSNAGYGAGGVASPAASGFTGGVGSVGTNGGSGAGGNLYNGGPGAGGVSSAGGVGGPGSAGGGGSGSGGGGGGGGASISVWVTVVPGDVYAYVQGAGGIPGASGTASTMFGLSAGGGAPGAANAVGAAGGNPGAIVLEY